MTDKFWILYAVRCFTEVSYILLYFKLQVDRRSEEDAKHSSATRSELLHSYKNRLGLLLNYISV